MEKQAEELVKTLLGFKGHCDASLEQARELKKALIEGRLESVVNAPFHLGILLDKYLELIETRLGPALKCMDTPAVEQVKADMAAQAAEEAPVAPAIEFGDEDISGMDIVEDADGATRRTIPRYNQRLPVRYRVPGRDKSPLKAFSRDIGALGLFIVANHLEKTGQNLNIEIELPEHGTISMQGTVVWTKWVPPALRSVDYPGFAVKIHSAPEAWFTYFMEVEESHTQ